MVLATDGSGTASALRPCGRTGAAVRALGSPSGVRAVAAIGV